MTSSYLDLSRKKLELERMFSSVINKIPDLCHPTAPILEGEEDYFNKTKDLKLVPFKKQEVFERCVTPTLDEQRHELVSSPTGDFIDIERSSSSSSVPIRGPSRRGTKKPSPRVASSSELVKHSKVSFMVNDHDRLAAPRRRAEGVKRSSGESSRATAETREKLEQRQRLHERYSGLKLRTRPAVEESRRHQLDCLDKIFVGDSHEEASYPFADPMPECMLTRTNMDNLRNIIVSSTDIEWRMLTPIRPASEYEELYFDRLIQLHRNHFKYQMAEQARRNRQGDSEAGKPTFKHTRHGVVLPQQLKQSVQARRDGTRPGQVTMSFGVKLKGKFHARSRSHRSGSALTTQAGRPNVGIPQLLLTAEEETAGEPEASAGPPAAVKMTTKVLKQVDDDDADEGDEDSNRADDLALHEDFSYESFSRFARSNLAHLNNRQARAEEQQEGSLASVMDEQQQQLAMAAADNGDGLNVLRADGPLDEQIDDIMSSLLNTAGTF